MAISFLNVSLKKKVLKICEKSNLGLNFYWKRKICLTFTYKKKNNKIKIPTMMKL